MNDPLDILASLPIVQVVAILLATFFAAGKVTNRLGGVETKLDTLSEDVKKQAKQQARLKRAFYKHVDKCSNG
jgi:hypothetical protein